jgi:hypothetical protein
MRDSRLLSEIFETCLEKALRNSVGDGVVDSVGLGDRRVCNECEELLESEQWLAL